MLYAVKILVPTANPRKILVDFERAAITAFEAASPMATVNSILFSSDESVIRKVNEIGMKVDYQTNEALRTCVRCLPALAFVPPDDVSEAFDLLVESLVEHEQMNELLSFFEHTYVRGRWRWGRWDVYGPALFNIKLWNEHEAMASLERQT